MVADINCSSGEASPDEQLMSAEFSIVGVMPATLGSLAGHLQDRLHRLDVRSAAPSGVRPTLLKSEKG